MNKLIFAITACGLMITACGQVETPQKMGAPEQPAGVNQTAVTDKSAKDNKAIDQPFKTKAETPVNFALSNTGISHIYFPFTEARSEWVRSGNGVGQGDHLGDDYYADDWNYYLGGNSDIGKTIVAPISGSVLYVYKGASNGDGPACPNASYGNRVIIANDQGFAVHATHLQDVSVSVGQTIKIGDRLGTVGSSGLSGRDGCTAHVHLVFYKNIDQISPRGGLGKTGREWLKNGNAPSGISGGASMFAAPFYADATTGGIATNTSGKGIFDGAGSVVSAAEDCFGCNKDIAVMHPHPGTGSTVVFQALKDATYNHHIDLQSERDLDVIVKVKPWSDHYTAKTMKISLKANTPVSIELPSTWTVMAIISAQPITQATRIYAYAKKPSDTWNTGNVQTLPNDLVDVTYDYFWTGTGSLITSAQQRQGFGVRMDYMPTFTQHNSLTTFQWLSSASCPQIEVSSVDGKNVAVELATKNWSSEDFENKCTSVPCSVSANPGMYIVGKIKSAANAFNGGQLQVKCK